MKNYLKRYLRFILAPILLIATILVCSGQTWTGGGANDNWSTAGNWTSLPTNDGSDQLVFSGTVGLTPFTDVPWSLDELVFDATAGSFTLSGSDITVISRGGGYFWLENNSSNRQIINNNIIYSGTATNHNIQIRASAGDIVINGDLDLGEARAWLGSTNNPTFTTIEVNGTISGTGPRSLDIGQRGMVVVLSGNNTFTGDLLNQRAQLILRHNNALGSANSVEFARNNNPATDNSDAGVLTEGALTISSNFLVGDNTNTSNPSRAYIGGNSAHNSEFSGDITLGTNAVRGRQLELVSVEGGQVTFSGDLLGAGTDNNDGVVKVGSGTVILSGLSNTYKGTTIVSEGTLLINGAFGANGLGVLVEDGATLGGLGLINRAIEVQSGATLIGGSGFGVSETLSVNADLLFQAGSEIQLVLGAGGTLSSLSRSGGIWVFSDAQLFTFEGTPEVGTYLGLITGLSGSEAGLSEIANWGITNSELVGEFSYSSGSINLEITAIPEPSTVGLLIAAILFPAVFFRKRFYRQ